MERISHSAPGFQEPEIQVQRLAQSRQAGQQRTPEARSSYSFRDSRHVVKSGIAAVSLDLTVEEANAENIALLGFTEGDTLLLTGQGSLSGTARILTLNTDQLRVQICLDVPPEARRAARIVFARLTPRPCRLSDEGQMQLTVQVCKDGKGGYRYALTDNAQSDAQLMGDSLDLRIDDFATRQRLHQVLTFIVASGENLTWAIEHEAPQHPSGKLRLSLAAEMGTFDVSRQPQA